MLVQSFRRFWGLIEILTYSKAFVGAPRITGSSPDFAFWRSSNSDVWRSGVPLVLPARVGLDAGDSCSCILVCFCNMRTEYFGPPWCSSKFMQPRSHWAWTTWGLFSRRDVCVCVSPVHKTSLFVRCNTSRMCDLMEAGLWDCLASKVVKRSWHHGAIMAIWPFCRSCACLCRLLLFLDKCRRSVYSCSRWEHHSRHRHMRKPLAHLTLSTCKPACSLNSGQCQSCWQNREWCSMWWYGDCGESLFALSLSVPAKMCHRSKEVILSSLKWSLRRVDRMASFTNSWTYSGQCGVRFIPAVPLPWMLNHHWSKEHSILLYMLSCCQFEAMRQPHIKWWVPLAPKPIFDSSWNVWNILETMLWFYFWSCACVS